MIEVLYAFVRGKTRENAPLRSDGRRLYLNDVEIARLEGTEITLSHEALGESEIRWETLLHRVQRMDQEGGSRPHGGMS